MVEASTVTSAVASLGRIGLPVPIRRLASKTWDAIVVGAGHNGLACAAYLARAGKRTLVIESRERIGGACTVDEPFPGVRMSPCAYLNGLLHPLVIKELGLPARGFTCDPATNGLFVPFEDGSSVQLYDDDDACAAEIARLAPRDVVGFRAMSAVVARLRRALRPPDDRDVWIGTPPTRDELDARIGNDPEARALLFDWSMAEFVEHYLTDERLQIALMGQGVIGTNASPFDPGTASVRFHHSCGSVNDLPGTWGYVRGGMGMISLYLCDAATEAGATVVSGVPVARILPGEGVLLASGERITAPVIVSNADPKVTLSLVGRDADAQWRNAVDGIPMLGASVKCNVWLRELPNFCARPGTHEPHHAGQINTPLQKSEWRAAYAAARTGKLADRLWTELYFQSVFDPSVAPPGTHTMSVFSQYVPYTFDHGTWDERRSEVRDRVIESIGRFCSNLPDAIIDAQVLGPPDIEQKVGLTGGHIFQGEILPGNLWANRLSTRTPMPGVYLCGAATHPGGSVIAINGRNAAMAILEDARVAR